MNRRTKIVCTLGPATATPDRLRELIQAGMDVARLNFSHGDREDHKRVYDMILYYGSEPFRRRLKRRRDVLRPSGVRHAGD